MMNFEAIRRALKDSPLAVITEEIPADLLTPASVLVRLGGTKAATSFLFESVEGGENVGRYSFIGVDPAEEICCHEQGGWIRTGTALRRFEIEQLLSVLRSRLPGHLLTNEDAPDVLAGGWVGYFGYECARLFELLPDHAADTLGHPWLWLGLYDEVAVFDHARQSARVVMTIRADGASRTELRRRYDRTQRRLAAVLRQLSRPVTLPPLAHPVTRPVRSNLSRRQFADGVRTFKRHIARGDIFQGVLSQRFTRDGAVPPFDVYRRLRRANPSPYMYFLKFRDLAIAGSSPETLVQKKGALVTTRPIAGTRPRGATPQEDHRREHQLMASPKENAEHVMLVDLGRNDLGRVCRPGTVVMDQFRSIDRYSHVMHMVSTVRGRARRGVDALDVLAATFPAGTVTGAPKIRAMELIDSVEPDRRGVYAGSVGYIDWWGNMDMAIAIRTAVMDQCGAHVQAGAGIVADSDPEREYRETQNKAAAPLSAIGGTWGKGDQP